MSSDWPDKAPDFLQIAFADMPKDIEKAPAYGLKDGFGNNYAIELPAHIVVAAKSPYGLVDVGSVVAISQDAIMAAERLGREVILYVHSTQKHYLTSLTNIKQNYSTFSGSKGRDIWVVPMKHLKEYGQAKADKMQGILL